jgi:hypothetical protein
MRSVVVDDSGSGPPVGERRPAVMRIWSRRAAQAIGKVVVSCSFHDMLVAVLLRCPEALVVRGGVGGGEENEGHGGRNSDLPVSKIHPHGWRREGNVEEGMVEVVE